MYKFKNDIIKKSRVFLRFWYKFESGKLMALSTCIAIRLNLIRLIFRFSVACLSWILGVSQEGDPVNAENRVAYHRCSVE